MRVVFSVFTSQLLIPLLLNEYLRRQTGLAAYTLVHLNIMRYFIFLLIFLSLPSIGRAEYEVRGKVNLGEGWQPKVFLAAIHDLNDYYRTSAKMIINTAEVDGSGHFVMSGENLPKENLFYRLYVMKTDNTDFDACIYVGDDDRNFVHLILNNSTQVEVITDEESIAPFGNFKIKGGKENQLMQQLSTIVFPSFYFYKIQFPTELKFSEEKLHSDLKSFADTCSNTLVALSAVHNMDFDNFFENNKDYYIQFREQVNRDLPKSSYTSNFNRKVNYYLGENDQVQSGFWKYTSFGFMALSAFLFWLWRNSLAKQNQGIGVKEELLIAPLTDKLTKKEKEILSHIKEGKSNKEIASALFVEVSTVKSHINKIYSKLEVSNRSELL